MADWSRALRRYRGPLPDRYRLPSRYAPAVFISSCLIIGGNFAKCLRELLDWVE
jgi:hypothetical protein